MKKIALVLVIILLFSGCTQHNYINKQFNCKKCNTIFSIGSNNNLYCEYCDESCSDCGEYFSKKDSFVKTDDKNICYHCAINGEYIKCMNCGSYYQFSTGDTTKYYCVGCVEDNASVCCFCGGTYIDYDDLAEFKDGSQTHYMCVLCCEEYLNIISSTDLKEDCVVGH